MGTPETIWFAISGLVNGVACIIMGGFVLLKNPRDARNRYYALFSLPIGFYNLLYFFWAVVPSPQEALPWFVWICNFVILLNPFFLHFSAALTNTVRRHRFALTASYLLSGFFIFANYNLWLYSELIPRYRWGWWPVITPLCVIFHVFWIGQVLIAHWWLLQGFWKSEGVERQRLKWTITGTIIGYLGGMTNWFLWYNIPIPPMLNILITPLQGMIAYAIVKHQLLDIRVAITRTGLMICTYFVVLGVPFFVGWYIRRPLEFSFGENWWLFPLVTSTILATVGPSVYAYLRNRAEERLLRDQRRYQRFLQSAARGMTQVRDVGRLSRLITRVISRAVGISHASIFLWDAEHRVYRLESSAGPARLSLQSRYELADNDALIQRLSQRRSMLLEQQESAIIAQRFKDLSAAVIVPGVMGGKLIGLLALGRKLSDAEYSSDDMHAFETLAHEAAIAIDNARSYEELAKANEYLRAITERLIHQERLAAVGQFAAGMAHEIKNPLAAIKTFAEFLPERYKDDDFREKFFRIIQSEIERINGIVLQLSDLAKPAPLKLVPVDLAPMIRDILTLVSGQCLRQHVDISAAIELGGLVLDADASQMKQVFLNLLMNSMEAMEKGGKLTVSGQKGAQHIILVFADTGCGIPPEQVKQIWDPFFTTKARGMGLGLAIVRDVVERHGGVISINSSPGYGTRIDIRLPIHSKDV